jgi:hypothetical protein
MSAFDGELPSPGRPLQLATDEEDARHLLAVVQGLAAFPAEAAGRDRVLREALWFLWEKPRLPLPLVVSKYPALYPWSAAARASVASGQGWRAGGMGLIFEHLVPRQFLRQKIFQSAAELTPGSLVELLSTSITAAIITKDEDAALARTGLSHRQPGAYAGPWSRYLAAGLDLSGFAPLDIAAARGRNLR